LFLIETEVVRAEGKAVINFLFFIYKQ